MSDTAKIITDMKANPLFDSLPQTAFSELAALCDIESFESGERLIEENGENASLFLLTKGRVTITINNTEVGSQQAGETVGEISMAKISPPVADVTADGHVETISIPTRVIDTFCADYPDFAESLRATGMQKVYDR